MAESPSTVGIAPGAGLVARFGTAVVYLAETDSAERILDAVEAESEGAHPGAAIARRLAGVVFGGGAEPPAFGVVAPTEDGTVVLLRGNVFAQILGAEGPRALSGARAFTWVDEIVREPVRRIRVGEDNGEPLTVHPATDLRAGVVTGSGFELRVGVRRVSPRGRGEAAGAATAGTSVSDPPEPAATARGAVASVTAAATTSSATSKASPGSSPASNAAAANVRSAGSSTPGSSASVSRAPAPSAFGFAGAEAAVPSTPEPQPSVPRPSAPDSSTPGSTTAGSTTPGSTTAGSTTPGSSTPGSTAPGSPAPGSTTPGSTAARSLPQRSTAAGSSPSFSAPGSSEPGVSTPDSPARSTSAPGSSTVSSAPVSAVAAAPTSTTGTSTRPASTTASAAVKSPDAKSAASTATEPKPAESTSDRTGAGKSSTVEADSAAAKAVESKPAEPKPTESRQTEPKSAELKSAEAKSAAAKLWQAAADGKTTKSAGTSDSTPAAPSSTAPRPLRGFGTPTGSDTTPASHRPAAQVTPAPTAVRPSPTSDPASWLTTPGKAESAAPATAAGDSPAATSARTTDSKPGSARDASSNADTQGIGARAVPPGATGSGSHAITSSTTGSDSHAVTSRTTGSGSHAITSSTTGSSSHAITSSTTGPGSHAITPSTTGSGSHADTSRTTGSGNHAITSGTTGSDSYGTASGRPAPTTGGTRPTAADAPWSLPTGSDTSAGSRTGGLAGAGKSTAEGSGDRPATPTSPEPGTPAGPAGPRTADLPATAPAGFDALAADHNRTRIDTPRPSITPSPLAWSEAAEPARPDFFASPGTHQAPASQPGPNYLSGSHPSGPNQWGRVVPLRPQTPPEPPGALVFEDVIYPLDRGYVIGRNPSGDEAIRTGSAAPLTLPRDRHVSRVHAYVTLEAGVVYVRDAGTSGGTYIAAPGVEQWTRIGDTAVELAPGWRMRLGQKILTHRPPTRPLAAYPRRY